MPHTFKIEIELSDERIKKIAEDWNVDEEEVIETLNHFQEEVMAKEGLELLIDNIDLFNY